MKSVTFEVDHTKLGRGLYLASTQKMGNVVTYTFDLRLRTPYTEPTLTEVQMHTLEHVFATALRSIDDTIEVVYFGPMGCATGFYIVLQLEDLKNESTMLSLCVNKIHKALIKSLTMDTVPAKNQYQCGNYNTLGDISDISTLLEEILFILHRVFMRKSLDQYTYLGNTDLGNTNTVTYKAPENIGKVIVFFYV